MSSERIYAFFVQGKLVHLPPSKQKLDCLAFSVLFRANKRHGERKCGNDSECPVSWESNPVPTADGIYPSVSYPLSCQVICHFRFNLEISLIEKNKTKKTSAEPGTEYNRLNERQDVERSLQMCIYSGRLK